MQPLQADFFSKDFFKQWAPAIIVGAANHSYRPDLRNAQTAVDLARKFEMLRL